MVGIQYGSLHSERAQIAAADAQNHKILELGPDLFGRIQDLGYNLVCIRAGRPIA